jgi:hypothetical protein
MTATRAASALTRTARSATRLLRAHPGYTVTSTTQAAPATPRPAASRIPPQYPTLEALQAAAAGTLSYATTVVRHTHCHTLPGARWHAWRLHRTGATTTRITRGHPWAQPADSRARLWGNPATTGTSKGDTP